MNKNYQKSKGNYSPNINGNNNNYYSHVKMKGNGNKFLNLIKNKPVASGLIGGIIASLIASYIYSCFS